MLSHPAHLISFGFGAGLAPWLPGTAGTLLALPLFWAIAPRLGPAAFLSLWVALFALGVWACGKSGRALGIPDYGGFVWDEICAFLLVLFFTPDGPGWQAFAFAIFRCLDIVKPPPIRYYETRFKGGFGVMFDDLLAAFYTLFALAVWKHLAG